MLDFQRTYIEKNASGSFVLLKGTHRSSFDILGQIHNGAEKQQIMETKMKELERQVALLKAELKGKDKEIVKVESE